MTSNRERDFPPAFLRRCLQYEMPQPDAKMLVRIVEAHLGSKVAEKEAERISSFFAERNLASGNLATDQLLNLLYLITGKPQPNADQIEQAKKVLLRDLSKGT